MEQTVYVDLFFLINFSMDFLCVFLSASLLGTKLKIWRGVLAAILGGIYANVALFIPIFGIGEIIIDLLVCILMCFVAFGWAGGIISHSCVYIAIAMALGGVMTALFEILNRCEIKLDGVDSDGISAWVLLLLAGVSAVLTLRGGKFFRKKSSRKYTVVTVRLNGKSVKLSAFCDSGNFLRDPISGKACIIADAEALSPILPKELLERATLGINTDTAEFAPSYARRIRLIPARTATGSGMLMALRTDGIVVGEGKDGHEVDALVAISNIGKSSEGCYALVPLELIKC